MKCPICRQKRTILGVGTGIRVPALLYQRSYPRKKEYISPRCSKCFDEALGEKK